MQTPKSALTYTVTVPDLTAALELEFFCHKRGWSALDATTARKIDELAARLAGNSGQCKRTARTQARGKARGAR